MALKIDRSMANRLKLKRKFQGHIVGFREVPRENLAYLAQGLGLESYLNNSFRAKCLKMNSIPRGLTIILRKLTYLK